MTGFPTEPEVDFGGFTDLIGLAEFQQLDQRFS